MQTATIIGATDMVTRTRSLFVAAMAFFTLIDLFAAQAILPLIASRFGTGAVAAGVAVNASTLGMAIGGLAVALGGQTLDRRRGIVASMALLAIPTALLAFAPNLVAFAALRIVQGLLMSTAFGLALAYLGERWSGVDAAVAFAAYVTGNIASNLVGRFVAAASAAELGVSGSFQLFALLNLIGAAVVAAGLRTVPTGSAETMQDCRADVALLRDSRLLVGFATGFLLLFAFVGVFTFVNFVLVRPPLGLGMAAVGTVYFVFVPAILITPLTGRLVTRLGPAGAIVTCLAAALAGLPLLLLANLAAVLGGMALVAAGTFAAQAVATSYVSAAAGSRRIGASGLYLACYFSGGLAGTIVIGLLFEQLGWTACTIAVAIALLLAAALGSRFEPSRKGT